MQALSGPRSLLAARAFFRLKLKWKYILCFPANTWKTGRMIGISRFLCVFMRLICKFQELDTNKILRYNPDKFTEGTGVEVYFSVSATDVKAIPCICNGSLERVLRQIKKENRERGAKDIGFFYAKNCIQKWEYCMQNDAIVNIYAWTRHTNGKQ